MGSLDSSFGQFACEQDLFSQFHSGPDASGAQGFSDSASKAVDTYDRVLETLESAVKRMPEGHTGVASSDAAVSQWNQQVKALSASRDHLKAWGASTPQTMSSGWTEARDAMVEQPKLNATKAALSLNPGAEIRDWEKNSAAAEQQNQATYKEYSDLLDQEQKISEANELTKPAPHHGGGAGGTAPASARVDYAGGGVAGGGGGASAPGGGGYSHAPSPGGGGAGGSAPSTQPSWSHAPSPSASPSGGNRRTAVPPAANAGQYPNAPTNGPGWGHAGGTNSQGVAPVSGGPAGATGGYGYGYARPGSPAFGGSGTGSGNGGGFSGAGGGLGWGEFGPRGSGANSGAGYGYGRGAGGGSGGAQSGGAGPRSGADPENGRAGRMAASESAATRGMGRGGSGGMMPGGGAGGKKEEDRDHKNKLFMVDGENTSELVGELPATAPPVIQPVFEEDERGR